MPPQNKHIFITGSVVSEKYKPPKSRGPKRIIPSRDRVEWSAKLLNQFEAIWHDQEIVKSQRTAAHIPTRMGSYIEFAGQVGADLMTKSLESISKGIRLLNIREDRIGEQKVIKTTVYIPKGLEGYFINKVIEFRDKDIASGKPKNEQLISSIEDVSVALLEALWTDNKSLIPTEISKWCEVWLNISTDNADNKEAIQGFVNTLNTFNIEHKPNHIIFPERAVVLINANKDQLLELMMRSDLLAEFRIGQATAGFWLNESSIEQHAWAEDLISRLEIDQDSNVKVCILDGGVNNGHQLLQPILSESDTMTVVQAWGTNDHRPGSGHGTLMAGLIGYGNFEQQLVQTNQVLITHHLCSVKILPPPTEVGTAKELWGDITSQGISIAEIQNPEKVLLFCMAVTSEDDVDQGRPSSWSGAIDNLAYGDGENQRLIIVSAGNVGDDLWKDYPDSNYASSIQNPAQSWNALTIGAYTEKITVNDVRFEDHNPLSPRGGLSPYSTTSLVWDKRWPTKPDVVFEGGNLLRAPDQNIQSHSDLDLLSTSRSFNIRPFDTIWATSAATAKASWFAAKIAYEYPSAWAETLRGLVVHSASWLEIMSDQMNLNLANKGEVKQLLKVFGHGVPSLEKALYNSESAFTFIAQQEIQPFSYKEENGRLTLQAQTNEIHFYDLPWPKDLLEGLGNIPVTLRITLSYFIEPGAGEIGWKEKYRYQSYGLRFDINNVGETKEEFSKRINKVAKEEDDEEEVISSGSGSSRWVIGIKNRSTGSIHSDFWQGTAAELSTCNLIAVFPVIGWWRERKHLKKVDSKARYSLIISLETPAEDVELYTTVKNIIETQIAIRI